MNKTQIETVQRVIEPLCDATARLLQPLHFMDNDRMHVALDRGGRHFIVTFFAMRNGQRTYASSVTHKFAGRVPERREIDHLENRWSFAATDFTALVMNAHWRDEAIEFTPEARVMYEFLLVRFFKQTLNSRAKAAYKLEGAIPELPRDFVDHPQRPLMKFQRVALATQLFEQGANLWMEQGTGKTPVVISRINYESHALYQREKRMYRALIVVPKNMRMNWHNKIVDFAVRPGKVTVLRGGQLERIKLLVESFKSDSDSEYTVVICSYEAVTRSWEALRMVEWDFCCLDEAHMIKGHYTKRWTKMTELRELCKSRVGLTGTPIANSLFDAYTQLEWLGDGLSGFSNFKAFREYYGKWAEHENKTAIRQQLVGYKNLPVLQERIARLCFMITRKEAMPELPSKTYDVLEIEMTPMQRDYYIALQKQLMIEIQLDMEKSKKQMTANHVLTKLLRLSQITAGYVKWDAQFDDEGNLLNGDGLYEEITPNPKIEAVVELLKSKQPDEKTIIWTNWVAAIKMLSKRLAEEGIKHVTYWGGTSDDNRQIAQDTYNMDPEVKVFIGNPAAGGVGLDLWGYIPEWAGTPRDHGCNTTQVIYFSQSWSMIHRGQSEDRAMRRGTRVPVQVTDVVMPGTIDVEIMERVLNKQVSAMQLQDVRDIMERVLRSVPRIGDDNA